MFRISLVNMPFAALNLPSLGLTQLKHVLDKTFGDKVSLEICYANQDIGKIMGVDPYEFVASGKEGHNSGLGEWIFRQAAFPELPDNIDDYFRRFFPHQTEQTRMYRYLIEEKRRMFGPLLDQLIEKYRLAESNIVGFTSMFTQNVASFAVARRIRDRNPDVILIMGGANCESPMGQQLVKNVKCIDFTFSGSALKSFPEFVGYILNGEAEKCHQINGVFSKLNCSAPQIQATLGGQAVNGLRELGDELDLDELVELDYEPFLDQIEKNFPNKDVEPNLLFESSRGCWWGEKAHCTFCGLNGATMYYRSMKPENAINLISSFFKFSSKVPRVSAVDNILPKSYLKDVLPFLKTPKEMTLFYEVKADLSEEDVQTLAKSRVKSIQPGIESLATSTLRLMKKGTNAFQNLQLLKWCSMYDVSPEWNLLIGFPGEGDDVYRKYVRDLPLLTHLPPPSGVYPVRFDRYSPYFNQAKAYELDLTPLDYYRFAYPFDEETLSKFVYYFADKNANAAYFVMMVKWIGKIEEKVQPWRSRWYGGRNGGRPTLYFKEKGKTSTVFDSRSGKGVERKIGEVGTRILDMLAKPTRMLDLASELNRIPGVEPEKEMVSLRDAGLIFEEGDRLFSLVLSKEPPRPDSSPVGGFAL
jgi:ribosomal peptide maturation radical SAM protein 1